MFTKKNSPIKSSQKLNVASFRQNCAYKFLSLGFFLSRKSVKIDGMLEKVIFVKTLIRRNKNLHKQRLNHGTRIIKDLALSAVARIGSPSHLLLTNIGMATTFSTEENQD